MAELPSLPDRILRLHKLRWSALVARHGFSGDHLKWHTSPKMRRQAARPKYSLAPPPLSSGREGDSTISLVGADGEEIAYQEWLEQQHEAWRKRQDDPYIIDSIGVVETVLLSKAWFGEVIANYFDRWAYAKNPDSDEFQRWTTEIAKLVVNQVGDLWRSDEWHGAWFERACRSNVEIGIRDLAQEWAERASKLEILSLENPYVPMRSLLGADADSIETLSLQQHTRIIERVNRPSVGSECDSRIGMQNRKR